MRRRRWQVGVLILLGTGAGWWGCSARSARHTAGSPAPTTSPVSSLPAPAAATMPAANVPATRPRAFARPKLGIELAYPPGWEARPNKDYELFLAPAGTKDGGDTVISLDVPELPFHVPGMIPIGSVRSGYLDDLKKQVGPVTTEDLPAPNVGATAARLVRSRWTTSAGEGVEETALLMVHGDHVYLLRERAAGATADATRAAFDEVVRSVRWVKP